MVDPIKPTLEAPRISRQKLKYDTLFSVVLQFDFQVQLPPLHYGTEDVGPFGRLAHFQHSADERSGVAR